MSYNITMHYQDEPTAEHPSPRFPTVLIDDTGSPDEPCTKEEIVLDSTDSKRKVNTRDVFVAEEHILKKSKTVNEAGSNFSKSSPTISSRNVAQDPGYRNAKVCHKEDWQPISLNKNSVKRQYYRKVKEPELVSLQDVKQLSGNTASLRSALPQYKDTEDSDPDNLLHCPECGAKWGGKCPLHGILHFVTDVAVPSQTSNPLRADLTTPYVVNIRSLLNGESSVFARMPIPIRTRFGPYEGQIVSLEEASDHAWLIRKDGKPDHCVDALDPGRSNWMRFVRNSSEKGKENLLAYQYLGKLYYMTIRNIFPDEELLVWCGSKYKQPLEEVQDSQNQPEAVAEVARNIKKEILDAVREVSIGSTHIKKEDEDADIAMQDHLTEDRIISEDRRRYEDLFAIGNAVKTEVDDDSLFCESGPEKIKRGGKRKDGDQVVAEDQPVEVVQDIEGVGKRIKMEVSDDKTSFIKEEVEEEDASQSEVTDKVNGLLVEACDDQKKRRQQDPLGLDCAWSLSNENGTVTFEEDACTNGYGASCNILPAASEEASARVEVCPGEKAETTADLHSDEVHSEIRLVDQPRKIVLSCTSCKKSFPCKAKLNRHLQLRHGGKPFVCKTCSMKFACKSGLTEHVRSHVDRHERNLQSSPEENHRSLGNVLRFACPLRNCSLRFGTRRAYQNHRRKHKIQMAVNCPKCLKVLGSQANLNIHLERTVCSYLPYICSKCRTAFNEHAKLEDHSCLAETRDNTDDSNPVDSENQENKRPYLCSGCNLHYDSRRELYDHFRLSHKPPSSIFCSFCKKRYSAHDVLRKHVRRVHSKEKPFECSTCKKRFFADANLQIHLSTHSENKTYTCVICVKDFPSKDELDNHSSTHENMLSCPLCDRPYRSYASLQQHICRKHRGAKLFECSECKEKFSYYSELGRHLEFHARQKLRLDEARADAHSNKTLTLFDDLDSEWTVKREECPDCNRVFFTDKALFNHVCAKLSGEKRFVGSKCNKEFNPSLDPKRCHQEERPYLCVDCNSDFSCQSLMDEHQCIGNNERPLACSECDRRFWSDAAYKRHLHSHVVDKPHVCSECAESFSQPELLEAHLQTHSKDIPFTCVECDPELHEKYRLYRNFSAQCDEEYANLTCVQCDRTFSCNGLSEPVSQDHRPFEFVSCEPE